ncbi:MAG TPA: aconitate hydratase [Candidatus Limnocylindrales bacterium]|nr:aconitate hydratase [Candidatus Limnocylindrales bacterium]
MALRGTLPFVESSHHQEAATAPRDPFGARSSLGPGLPDLYRLSALDGRIDLDRAPVTLKILLENALRHAGGPAVKPEDVETLASWRPEAGGEAEIPFMPSRVILQDFTGVPAVVDLSALRDAMAERGGDPARVNPLVPADLVIDHSVQVDAFGTPAAFAFNVAREYERNGERYQLLRWAQTAFRDLRVVPPGTGIVHQVNLEYLATVVADRPDEAGVRVAFPDTLVGTDSHTTMVNGLGVLGYGVGGIEAEAVLLGQPLYQPMPRIVGVRLTGELPRGSTATDLVLVVTELLRSFGVVGSFVEFAGDGLAGLALADRATISNMSPEFGATSTLFPIDDETLAYLRLTGRSDERVELVERYAKEQGLWRAPGDGPAFDALLTLDLATVVPSVAGPRRPQDRVPLDRLRENFRSNFPAQAPGNRAGAAPARRRGVVEESSVESFPASDPPSFAGGDGVVGGNATPVEPAPPEPSPPEPVVADGAGESPYPSVALDIDGEQASVRTGSVVIAAITSCTNTSNPTVMVGAGLLARNAVRRGLKVPPTVKTSLAPGSKAVTTYLAEAGLMAPLEELGFALAGYGCTTCIGNSGPLDEPIAKAIEDNDLAAVAVLSGNRNFEGRIHPLARASYLASPPLVVAFALAGRVDANLAAEPLGIGDDGKPVYLADLWPAAEEIRSVIRASVDPELFRETYATVFEGDDRWRALPIPDGDRYDWAADSTYVTRPPFVEAPPEPPGDIVGARALAVLGDSVTTDHISPAGSIATWSPAGQWLQAHGVPPLEFNSYGARRGHHEVMVRGTFGNIRLRNALVEKEGPYTRHWPSGDELFIYDAAMRYAHEGVPLVIIAGREYGSGSSRDWAAKGPALLGVRAVIAETYERIHRSNLVGMGILPLQFLPGENAASLGLTGRETFTIRGLAGRPEPRRRVTVEVRDDGSGQRTFQAICRLDGPIEVDYYLAGGILPAVLDRLAAATA